MNRRRLIAFVGAIAISAVVAIVGSNFLNQPAEVVQAKTKLIVSAAASLQDSIVEIQPVYSKTKQNINVNYNFAASGALQQQIENGAPVDVFISASQKHMDKLESKGLIVSETRRNLLTNSLVLVVPKNANNISKFEDLASAQVKRIAIGEPRSVPVGQYAEEVLNNLKIWQQLQPKFVLGNNVRQVLAAVESGNADAGIVYQTDALSSDRVKVVAIAPSNLHSPIVYPVAVLKSSKNINEASEYVKFLSQGEAATVFKKYGFGITP